MNKLNRSQRGVAMVEALVAMTIFAIGVLGVVGMQILAAKSVTDGKYRADAAYMVGQLVSQMWSEDRSNLPGYAHLCGNVATGCAPSCSPAGLASQNTNVQAWISELMRVFPADATSGSQVQISVVPVLTSTSLQTLPTYLVAVTVCWRLPKDPAGIYHSHVVAAQIS